MVDDEPDIGAFVRLVAEECGYDVETATTADAFKASFASKDADVIVLDLTMPDTDGIELLRYISEMKTKARILIMSGYHATVRNMALTLGENHGLNMAGEIPKPVRAADLRAVLKRLLPA